MNGFNWLIIGLNCENSNELCVISNFRRDVKEILGFLGSCVALKSS